MKIAVISDIHANLEALEAFPESYDELWVLGDLVNYGPDPAEAVEWVRKHAAVVIRGNHDHAIGFGEDCRCSPRFREMAEATRQYTDSVLSLEQKRFLRDLPDCMCRKIEGSLFFLCHATPSNLLFEYRQADSPKWQLDEDSSSGANVVMVGHTHLPFVRHFSNKTIVNPGSLGQSKAGDPAARYAVWKDGQLELKSFDYPTERVIAKIEKLPIRQEIKNDLAAVLQTGIVPATRDNS